MSNAFSTYANNHTELAANTPAAIGPGPGVVLRRVVITSTITGNFAIYDNASAASGPLLYFEATPAAGQIRVLDIRCKNGAWCVPGTAGTASVYFD